MITNIDDTKSYIDNIIPLRSYIASQYNYNANLVFRISDVFGNDNMNLTESCAVLSDYLEYTFDKM